MMKYFNVEIQTTGATTAQAMYPHDTKDEAIIAYHQSMASMRTAVDSGNLDGCTGLVLNEWGGVEQPYQEHYERAAEPNVEE